MYPSEYLYSREHEWVRVEGDLCTVGITQFATEELGEVVFVELPEVGHAFDTMEEIGTIESVKAVAELYTPVAGEIVEVNGELAGQPALVNQAPYEGGWMVKLKPANPADVDHLLDAPGYKALLEAHSA